MISLQFEDVETLVRNGRHREAKKAIAKLKKQGLSPHVRSLCSDWYLRIGLPNEAIKILGAELLESELKIADIDTLKLQARLAYMLGYFGANQSAERVSKKLEPFLLRDREFAALYYRYRGGNYMRVYKYRLAAESYEKVLNLIDHEKDFYMYQMMSLGMADGLEGIGQPEKAIEIASKVLKVAKTDQLILKGIAHQARGEYFFRKGNLENAEKDFKQSWEFFPKDITSRDYGFLAQWSGALHVIKGNRQKAQEELNLALKILSNDRMRPTNILEVVFWLSMLSTKKIPTEYWVLNTHPSQIPYSLLTGRHTEKKEDLHPWILKRLKKTTRPSYDTWLLESGKVKGVFYSDIVKKSKDGTIDLVSGVIYDRRTNQTLTNLKTKCLLALASSAHLGLSDWALIDYIYSEEWHVPQSMMIRLNDLVKQLRLQGFKITRRKNQFFWIPSPKLCILMPVNHVVQDVSHHLKCVMNSFTRLDIERLYGITPPTAKQSLKEWTSKKLISVEESGRNTTYHF